MWDSVQTMLTELTILSVTARLLMSILFGGMIGYDRQRKHHPAGLRTHILVCMGSTMTMMLGQYLAETYQSDPARIGAQVISGIGFLGAGTIMFSGLRVRGITTASGLWACACMGLMIGAGFYVGAALSFVFILFTLLVMRAFSKLYQTRHPRKKFISAYIRHPSDLTHIIKLLRIWGLTVDETHIHYEEDKQDGSAKEPFKNTFRAIISVTFRRDMDSGIIMANLLQEECVIYADYMKPEEVPEDYF